MDNDDMMRDIYAKLHAKYKDEKPSDSSKTKGKPPASKNKSHGIARLAGALISAAKLNEEPSKTETNNVESNVNLSEFLDMVTKLLPEKGQDALRYNLLNVIVKRQLGVELPSIEEISNQQKTYFGEKEQTEEPTNAEIAEPVQEEKELGSKRRIEEEKEQEPNKKERVEEEQTTKEEPVESKVAFDDIGEDEDDFGSDLDDEDLPEAEFIAAFLKQVNNEPGTGEGMDSKVDNPMLVF